MTFDPVLPLWLIAVMGGVALLACFVQMLRGRVLAGLLRALATAVIVVIALVPVRLTEQRERLADQAIALIDRSGSMALDNRGAQAEAALQALTSQTPEGLQWRVHAVTPSAQASGTRLFDALTEALGKTPQERLAGVVVISDGLAHDGPDLARLRSVGRPVHLIVAGDRNMVDRHLELTRAPEFGLVGSRAEIGVRLISTDSTPAPLRWSINGVAQPAVRLRPGQVMQLSVPLTRRGLHQVDLDVPRAAGETVVANNLASVSITAIREKLKVLLVSGAPYLGGRMWRDVLKGDGSIDLMHFTILRLPTSIDPTPVDELSLIPFPVDQLFEVQLPRFDLIIFDRFGSLDLLPEPYFENMVSFVEQGGGMLLTTGAEFARADNFAATALANILPVRPSGQVINTPYRFTLTDAGRRHPVTSALPAAWGNRLWGTWSLQVDAAQRAGDLLATGAGGKPLLVLSRHAKGRVATLLSDQLWYWARDVDRGGPRDELLKRLIHWLMQEPELEEDALSVRADGDAAVIAKRTLSDQPMSAVVTLPNGTQQTLDLPVSSDGARQVRLPLRMAGRYAVAVGAQSASLVWLGADPLELRQVVPTDAILRPAAQATGGGRYWLQQGVPQVRRVNRGAATAGAAWLGLVRNEAGRLLAVRRDPWIDPYWGVALALGLMSLAWAAERR